MLNTEASIEIAIFIPVTIYYDAQNSHTKACYSIYTNNVVDYRSYVLIDNRGCFYINDNSQPLIMDWQ